MVTLDELKEIFSIAFEDQYDTSSLSNESHLINDIGMNSISLLYMAMLIEEKYQIQFDNEDFKHLTTVEDVIKCIEGKIAQ